MDRPLALRCMLLASLAAGCAPGTGHYPSLLPRATEKQGFEEPAPPPPPVVAPDPALDARLAASRDAAASSNFEATYARARARITAIGSATEGSDAWLDAQVALGELDVARAAMRATLDDLEELAADRAVAGLPPYPALEQALEAARNDAAERDRRAAELAAMLDAKAR